MANNALKKTKGHLLLAKIDINTRDARIARLISENEQQARTLADRQSAIARLGEEADRRDKKIQEMANERDRMIRMVDQFTSIGITQPGLTANALRKT